MIENILKIAIIIIMIIFILLLIIKRFVYFHPSRTLISVPEHYQDIRFGPELRHGYFIPGQNQQVILFCHGNAGNISYRQNKITPLNNLGYDIMIFDYSGFGLSEGIPTEQNCYRDACLFMEKLLKQYKIKDIILYGESLGAAVAMYLAVKYNTSYVILDSPLPSIKRKIQNYPIISYLAFLFPEFNTEEYMKHYKGKTLVIHSINDEIIPYEITDTLRSMATANITTKGSHNDAIINWNQINDFIQNK